MLIKGLLLSTWVLFFVTGFTQYPGSKFVYSVFSIVFLGMIISGFYRQISYGYLFLVVMLWLGFWLKTTVHLLVEYPFGEPIGLFTGTSSQWDEVLLVATIAALGVLISRLIFWSIGCGTSMIEKDNLFRVPDWYLPVRKWLWFTLILTCISVAALNLTLGIELSGLTPQLILMWPLNAVIYWLLASGFSLFVATLLWWDISLQRNISSTVYLVLVEGFTSSISILSRGTYIFHVIPQMFGIYKNRVRVNGWTPRNITKFSVIFVLIFMISLPVVNTLRSYYYSDQAPVWSGTSSLEEFRQSAIKGTSTLVRFAVDRWVGTEGLMAVSAYPGKGMDLFIKGLTERGEVGVSSMYQEICLSHYPEMDLSKYRFASLPGATAFLYYTGSFWIVFSGMVLLAILVLISEQLLFKLTRNPLLAALWGGAVANTVVQMGVAPRGLLIYFFEMVCGIAAICFLQSELFSNLIRKFRRL